MIQMWVWESERESMLKKDDERGFDDASFGSSKSEVMIDGSYHDGVASYSMRGSRNIQRIRSCKKCAKTKRFFHTFVYSRVPYPENSLSPPKALYQIWFVTNWMLLYTKDRILIMKFQGKRKGVKVHTFLGLFSRSFLFFHPRIMVRSSRLSRWGVWFRARS